MYQLTQNPENKFIEMTENYRSTHHLVNFANEFAKNIGKRMKSTPIISMRKENGWVGVTYHQSKYMYQPLVEELLHQRGSGTSCVLTQTNEEAVILTALLRKHAINSKLIQSMDGFLFWNMAEMRYFLRYIEKRIKTPLIPEELWEKAKHVTYTTYEKSKSLTYVKRCIELFEQTYKVKYHSDFKEFVFESSVEDFCDISGTDVVVSTIHKAKGREFDNVYMLISDNYSKDDHLMRRYYVGMTRAKNQLFIHTNGNCFNHISADRHCIDRKNYRNSHSRKSRYHRSQRIDNTIARRNDGGSGGHGKSRFENSFVDWWCHYFENSHGGENCSELQRAGGVRKRCFYQYIHCFAIDEREGSL
jgi:ATP-dependent DNA helicase RecQ